MPAGDPPIGAERVPASDPPIGAERVPASDPPSGAERSGTPPALALDEVVASARAWAEEWLEEGVEQFTRAPAQSPVRSDPAPSALAADAPAPSRVRGHQASLLDPGSAVPDGASLDDVRELLGECTRCRLHEGRTQIVFGDGNPDADLLFVGEGPGEQEDLRGVPFVGRAGELLTQMIEKGLEVPRASVYICNIVKCRPPGNRTPMADEVQTCQPYLDGQIDAIRPKVIVALGKPATSLLLGREVPITRVRGQWHEYRGVPLMPTYHPAFILRQYTPQNRRLVWDDLKTALGRARELGAAL